MKFEKISKKCLIYFICIAMAFSNVPLRANAAGAVAKKLVTEFFKGVGWTLLWDAAADVGDKIYDEVKSWFSNDKEYYNIHESAGGYEHGGGGHRREPKYYRNNKPLSNAMNNYYTDNSITDDSITDGSITDNSVTNNQQFIDNSTTNQYTYTSFSSSVTDNRSYSLIKDSFNTTNNNYTTLLYNPITCNYTEVNNVYYNNQYDTYFITNNEYNYYVTNNYTYVSYYIINNETKEETYHEIYYEMPDGRNSYDLEKEDIWGEYFIYDVVGYESVQEDDGKTLALYHLDGDLKDSSYWKNADLSGGSGVYQDAKFSKGYYSNYMSNVYLEYPSSIDFNNFTLEFTVCITGSFSNVFLLQAHKNQGIIPSSYFNSSYTYGWFNLGNCSGAGIYNIILQSKDGVWTSYVNGKKSNFKLYNYYSFGDKYINTIQLTADSIVFGGNSSCNDSSQAYYLDEVRISNCALYDGDSVSVPTQAFDTNQVLAVPENPSENMIAVQGEYEVTGFRVGGVRPTYPTKGYVYVYLEDDVVKDVQQYEGDAWYSIHGAIYQDGEWWDLSGCNLSNLTFEEDDSSSGDDLGDSSGDGSSDSNSGGGTVSGNGSDGSGLGSFLDGIGKIFDTILSLIGKLMGVVADFAQSILDLFSGFTTFTDGFSDFLSGAFGFIPVDIWNVIKVGLSLMVLLAVIKFLRK